MFNWCNVHGGWVGLCGCKSTHSPQRLAEAPPAPRFDVTCCEVMPDYSGREAWFDVKELCLENATVTEIRDALVRVIKNAEAGTKLHITLTPRK